MLNGAVIEVYKITSREASFISVATFSEGQWKIFIFDFLKSSVEIFLATTKISIDPINIHSCGHKYSAEKLIKHKSPTRLAEIFDYKMARSDRGKLLVDHLW